MMRAGGQCFSLFIIHYYKACIDPLHVTSRFGHFRIHLFGRRHVGGRKCIAVIERKTLNASLFTNASDYSNKICMARSMCLYLTNIVVLLE